ncbi:MAG: hypothetical protein A2Y40_03335 [Candidatus Margulisbacteria bacterium GWF2_35_9]|nr:MAG: hypothetical protein A2Y40_03335 [Candidatus Margulisbacteria bacterium GWF2_35_9]
MNRKIVSQNARMNDYHEKMAKIVEKTPSVINSFATISIVQILLKLKPAVAKDILFNQLMTKGKANVADYIKKMYKENPDFVYEMFDCSNVENKKEEVTKRIKELLR